LEPGIVFAVECDDVYAVRQASPGMIRFMNWSNIGTTQIQLFGRRETVEAHAEETLVERGDSKVE
jgi:hypothetical protein